jgi:hypothetical protein
MNTSTKIACALVILTGFGSFPANALEPGECTPWRSILGGACKERKCVVGKSPGIRLVPETICPGAIVSRPLPPLDPGQVIPGRSRGSTAPQ